jgi:hypothetical protein
MTPLRRAGVAIVLLPLFAAPARAIDRYLSIGGGASASNSQVSLEKNIFFWQKVLGDAGLGGVAHDIYFASGPGPRRSRDVVFNDANASVPRVNELMAMLLDRQDDLFLSYRQNQVAAARGPANRRAITQWFERVGPTMADGDRLILYFTGHGGKGNPARNTTMDLWNDNPLTVRDLTALLDRLSPRVRVVLIMVQCHSGGFGDVIFRDATAGGPLTSARRCGFFSTSHDRLAAGCTPDINEEDYQDYSTSFFAALDGHTRTGGTVGSCDYDGDGRVSFAEAHAYALLASDTIDIPMTTSDTLLRSFSKTMSRSTPGLIQPGSSYPRLLKLATPAQRAVLEGLSEQLSLAGDDRAKAARETGDAIDRQRKAIDRDRNRVNREAGQLRNAVRYRVRARWPELSNAYHPRVESILHDEAGAVVRMIESDADFKKMQELQRQVRDMDDQSSGLERKWVKCQRFLQTLDTLALAANLEKVAAGNVVRKYQDLLDEEADVLAGRR